MNRTSRNSAGQPANAPPARTVSAAVRSNIVRSAMEADASWSSNCRNRAALSCAEAASDPSSSAVTKADRNSPKVEAVARAKPGKRATGSKYFRSPFASDSYIARAAMASLPSAVAGARLPKARLGNARRAASCVKLKRCSPKVAPCVCEKSRTRSSIASREEPTRSNSVAGGKETMNSTARAIRSAAEWDFNTRSMPVGKLRQKP